MGSASLPGRRFPWAAAALLHALCPLLFFVRKTENPYLVQILLLHIIVAAALAEYAWRAGRSGLWRYTATALDLPLWTWISVGALSWLAAWIVHAGVRETVWLQGLPGLLFLGLNAGGVFFLGAQLADGPGARRLRTLALAVGAVAAGYALLQYHGFDPIWPTAVNPFLGRPVSTYGNPNFLSTALALLLPLALRGALRSPGSAGAASAAVFLLMAGALIGTMTRSSYIGAAAGLALYLWWDRRLVRANPGRAAALAAALAALIFFWPASRLDPTAPAPAARLLDLYRGITGGVVYGSWHQRLLIWSAAWEMWRDNFWLGKGWGLFELFFPFYQAPHLDAEFFRGFRTHANNAHQLLLELAAQTGLIGLGIFLWIIAAAVAAARRGGGGEERNSLAMALAAGLVAALVDNFFGNVSLFFAVPAMLFFWSAGQWAALVSGTEKRLVLHGIGRGAAWLVCLLAVVVGFLSLRQWNAAVWFLRGRDAADPRAQAEAFERSRRWSAAEVGNAFQLGRVRMAQSRWAQDQGLTQEAARHRALARQALDEAVRANPGYSEIYFNRGAVAAADGRIQDAARDYRLALSIDPLAADGYWALGEIYRQTADDRAEALYAQAVRFFPREARFWFQLGAVRQGPAAADAHARAAALDLEFTQAWDALRRAGEPAARPGLLEAPGQADRVRRAARAGDWPAARRAADRLVALVPENTLARLMRADISGQLGERAAARADYEWILAREPGHADARRGLDALFQAADGEVNQFSH